MLLKHAAEGNLPLKLLNWYNLSHPSDCSFGLCEDYFPSRPKEKWKEVESTTRGKKVVKFEREFDAEESKQFYHVSNQCCFWLLHRRIHITSMKTRSHQAGLNFV